MLLLLGMLVRVQTMNLHVIAQLGIEQKNSLKQQQAMNRQITNLACFWVARLAVIVHKWWATIRSLSIRIFGNIHLCICIYIIYKEPQVHDTDLLCLLSSLLQPCYGFWQRIGRTVLTNLLVRGRVSQCSFLTLLNSNHVSVCWWTPFEHRC